MIGGLVAIEGFRAVVAGEKDEGVVLLAAVGEGVEEAAESAIGLGDVGEVLGLVGRFRLRVELDEVLSGVKYCVCQKSRWRRCGSKPLPIVSQ